MVFSPSSPRGVTLGPIHRPPPRIKRRSIDLPLMPEGGKGVGAGGIPPRFLTEDSPDRELPEEGMPARQALHMIQEDLFLDGDPQRNLATFVTTWMEDEARQLIAENLHRNFIDHAEYPQTAEMEQRCIRMLADLFHAPGETTGARTQGSSEAIMLGALALKWKWRARREADGKATDRPNLVFGGDVHVVWEKFCRYFDVEPRIVPLQEDKYTIGPGGHRAPRRREHDRGRGGGRHHLHRPRRRRRRDQQAPPRDQGEEGAGRPDARRWCQRRLRLALPLPGQQMGFPARAGPVDQRLGAQVRVRLSRDRLARLPRQAGAPDDLVFYENYLGKEDATFTLNFSTGPAMVLAQYYMLIRLGRSGYRYLMEATQENAAALGERIKELGTVQADRGRGAVAAGRLQPRRGAALRRVRHLIRARR